MQLLITLGASGSRQMSLIEHGILRVGRAAECEVRLEDPTASRCHVELRVDGGRLWLKDLNSRFGTYVNGMKTTECELRVGDEVRIGETTLRLDEGLQNIRTTMAPASPRGIDQNSAPASQGEFVGEPTKLLHRPSETSRRFDSASNPQKLVGQAFGRFMATSVVARTTRGVMLRGREDGTAREVALKVFWPEAMSGAGLSRFQRAARTMMPLKHPHLVELIEYGEDNGLCWSCSEWIEGENAEQLIRRIGIAGMLDWRQSLKVALHVARALDFAAQQQIVHRNLAPRHILIRNRDGLVKLGGLGLARSLDDDAAAKVTRAGEVVGELVYCSPEQVSGKPLDARSDLYNLGATLYALLTGRPPCEGRSFHETLDKIQSQRPEPPTKFHLAVPAQLEGIVMRLLEKRPDDRFLSAAQLVADLHRAARYLGETALIGE